jgi:hypothetical protein
LPREHLKNKIKSVIATGELGVRTTVRRWRHSLYSSQITAAA